MLQCINILIVILFIGSAQTIASSASYFDTIKSDPKALYAFLKEMPKGGELHYHLDGGADPNTLLKLATHGGYCLNLKTMATNKQTSLHCAGLSMTNLSSHQALYNRILRSWSMKEFTPTLETGHDHFFASFSKFMPVAAAYQPQLLTDIIRRAANQHELYLEIMIAPADPYPIPDLLTPQPVSFADWQHVLLSDTHVQQNIQHIVTESSHLLRAARHDLGCDLKSHPENTALNDACALTIKFQYYVLREQPLTKVFAKALEGFEAASKSPDLVGINLVQAEDGPISLRDYHEHMRIFNFLHAAYPKVHISLHAGELTHPTPQNATHIRDAIMIGHADRIGHGADIFQENNPEFLLTHMAKASIPVEINLISNRKILNMEDKDHPLREYLSHHVPVVLSTDDEGLLQTDLTEQYVEAVMHHDIDYATVKLINRNALTYSFLPGKSLWADPMHHITVANCHTLTSLTCQHFIKANEKARLQWLLEKKLQLFEFNLNSSALKKARSA